MMAAHRVLRLRESKSVVTGFIVMFHLIRTDRFVFYKIGGESPLGVHRLWETSTTGAIPANEIRSRSSHLIVDNVIGPLG